MSFSNDACFIYYFFICFSIRRLLELSGKINSVQTGNPEQFTSEVYGSFILKMITSKGLFDINCFLIYQTVYMSYVSIKEHIRQNSKNKASVYCSTISYSKQQWSCCKTVSVQIHLTNIWNIAAWQSSISTFSDFDFQAEYLCIMLCSVEEKYVELVLRKAVRFQYSVF